MHIKDLITLHPPKKTPLFWGGETFWTKILNFWFFELEKILGRLWSWADLPATYRPISGRLWPQTHNLIFKNMTFLSIFDQNLRFFFAKWDFGPKLLWKHQKQISLVSLCPKDVFCSYLDEFWWHRKKFFWTFFTT